jgi:GTP-binding protein EngB required for normal cell division
VRVRLATGETETVSLDGLLRLASEEGNPGNVKRVARLELVYPVPDLPEGVELVDTPGIGSLATTGTAETVAYLPRTDLALLLVDVGSSIGPDEIGLLRLFKSAAIPVEVLLSKADLVDEAALAKLTLYVSEVIAREAGMKPAVRAVSAVGEHRRLVRDWADERLKPVFARRAELAAESARRITGRLLERVVATLEQRLGGSTGGSDRNAAREETRDTDARIAEARTAVERLCEAMPSRWREPFAGAAIEAMALWNGGAPSPADIAPLLATELTREVDRARDLVVAELHGLEAALKSSAANVDPASAELLSEKPRGSLRSLLAGIPILDAEAVVVGAGVAKVRRPLLLSAFPRQAARRLALRLMDSAGTPVRDSLRTYGYRLRDFSARAVASLADSYHAAVGAALGAPADTAEAGAEARERIEAVLRELCTLQGRNVEGPE